MKTAKEITIGNRTYTFIECQDCGATTREPGRQTTKKARIILNRPCRSCSPVRRGRSFDGWWHDFGLPKNPMFTDRCHAKEPVNSSGLKKQGNEAGLPTCGKTSTQTNAKVLHQDNERTNYKHR